MKNISKNNWHHLIKLDLSHNMLGNKSLAYLSRTEFIALQLLNLSTNNITNAGLIYLNRA